MTNACVTGQCHRQQQQQRLTRWKWRRALTGYVSHSTCHPIRRALYLFLSEGNLERLLRGGRLLRTDIDGSHAYLKLSLSSSVWPLAGKQTLASREKQTLARETLTIENPCGPLRHVNNVLRAVPCGRSHTVFNNLQCLLCVREVFCGRARGKHTFTILYTILNAERVLYLYDNMLSVGRVGIRSCGVRRRVRFS